MGLGPISASPASSCMVNGDGKMEDYFTDAVYTAELQLSAAIRAMLTRTCIQ